VGENLFRSIELAFIEYFDQFNATKNKIDRLEEWPHLVSDFIITTTCCCCQGKFCFVKKIFDALKSHEVGQNVMLLNSEGVHAEFTSESLQGVV